MKIPSTTEEPKSALEQLSTQFTEWRAARQNRRDPIPLTLREQALTLLQDYSKAKIIKAIGINSTIFKNWQTPAQPTVKEVVQNTFVPLISSPTLPESRPAAIEFSLTFSAGHQVSIKGHFLPSQLTALVRGLTVNGEQA